MSHININMITMNNRWMLFLFFIHVCFDVFFEKRVSVRYICCLSNCDAPLLFSKWGGISGYEFENSGKNKEPDVKVHLQSCGCH